MRVGPSDGEDAGAVVGEVVGVVVAEVVGSVVGDVVGVVVGEEVGSVVGFDVGKVIKAQNIRTGCNSEGEVVGSSVAEMVGFIDGIACADSNDPDIVGLDVGEEIGLACAGSDSFDESTTTLPRVYNVTGIRAAGICDGRASEDNVLGSGGCSGATRRVGWGRTKG